MYTHMAKISTVKKNWSKYLLQWGVLAALVLFLTGLIPSKEAADPEAYCPLGGLQALATYLAQGSLPCSMSSLQVMMGIALVAAVVLFSKLFCAYVCPVGTVQDLLGKARKALHIKGVKVRNGSAFDKVLRIVKYALVFWIFYMTVTASELFCKNLDPYYAVATGFKGEITLWMSIVTVSLVVLGSFLIDMFWCRYLCPLGAVSNSLKFWAWTGVLFGAYYVADVLGADIPWAVLLGGFCITGYLLEVFHSKPKMQILYVMKDNSACNGCGLCTKKCPYGIDIKSCTDGKVESVDCTLCGECVAACSSEALKVGVCKNRQAKCWKYVPAILTVVLICVGMWAGGKFELPTIDMKWGIESVAEDGTVTQLVDPATLKTFSIEGLRSVKCYGSSMTFKAQVEKVAGVHGVKTFVNRHSVEILYDPARTTEEKIQEAIYTPVKFRVNTPDHNAVDSLKVVTIRTEKMYDKLDINYLGMQMRLSGKKIYGVESEFSCPLIVRVFMDPSEDLSAEWFKEIVEMDVLEMPVHGGGVNEIEVDYEFVKMEEGFTMVNTAEYVKNLFSGFSVQWKSRIEAAGNKQQYIYEIVDKNYEKPIILRNMPYLSNHLSKHEGVIGVYLTLNDDLQPCIRLRYADPMTEDRLWELITMETWTITYKADDVREEAAKFSFKTRGSIIEYKN